VRLRDLLGDKIAHYGWAEPDDYCALLRSSDIVISTAHHEFFGIAITEAIYAGAFPILPNRLVYPERIPSRFHDKCLYDDSAQLVSQTRWAIDHREEAATIAATVGDEMAAADWSIVARRYDQALEAAVADR
jgi:hypothetical protein